MKQYTDHITVLKNEVIEFLEGQNQSDEPLYGDFTFGGGGHSFELLKNNPKCKVIGLDQDQQALNNAKEKYSEFIENGRLKLVHSNFSQVKDLFSENSFDGICLDLGVSNHQFSEGNRGFSFREEGPLDMRMDFTNDEISTAEDLVNELDADELIEIFQNYGEEKFAKRIAEKIIEGRREKRIETTKELENIIFHCYPRALRFKKTHPATRVFQALRIAVNDEMGVIKRGIAEFFHLLKPGARLAIISFHSIEDRIVKQNFVNLKDRGKILTKKPMVPSEKEISSNPKSRSAKLRAIEKYE